MKPVPFSRRIAGLLVFAALAVPGFSGPAAGDVPEGYTRLFDGSSLDGWFTTIPNERPIWQANPDEGTLAREVPGPYLWTIGLYADFILELEFKMSRGGNSGVFFRANPADPVQQGFEIQLLDADHISKQTMGALYDAQAPSSNPARKAGEWNHLKLQVEGDHIRVWINGTQVNEVDLARWDTPNQNPDGSENKFDTALRDLPRIGHIGFQDHGDNVWFRNVFLKEL